MRWKAWSSTVSPTCGVAASLSQRTQYPLIKEYTLNNRGLNIMI